MMSHFELFKEEAKQQALQFLGITEFRAIEMQCYNAYDRKENEPFEFLVRVQQQNGEIVSACVDRYPDGRFECKASTAKNFMFE